MSEPNRMSRRSFIALVTAGFGALVTAVVGIPAIAYLLDPALKTRKTDAWIPLRRLDEYPVGTPTPFSFTRSQRNGWETTFNVYGGFVLRRSEAPEDLVVLSSRCTHLSCRVNWDEAQRAYVCPCHDAKFGVLGEVLSGPPPRPLDPFEYRLTADGVLEIRLVEG